MTLTLRAVGVTDVGRKRKNNEDVFVADEELGLFAVADGMGGHRAGEEASRLAVETVGDHLRAHQDVVAALARDPSEANKLAAHQLVYDAFQKACATVYAAQEADERKKGMGSTLVSVVRAGDRAIVGHVGDSRVYLFRGGSVYRLTEDHTLAEAQVKQGMLSREAAEKSDFRNVLLRAIGAQPSVQVDTLLMDLLAGDVLLLCSDGLHGYVRDEELPGLLARQATPADLPRALVDLANERGGKDNITALVVECRGEERDSLPASTRIEAIRKLSLFRSLDYREQVEVISLARLRGVPAGELLLREGTKGDEMFVVTSGRLSVERGGKVLAELGPGTCVGEMALVDDEPRSADVRTLEPCELLVVTRKEMVALMQREPVLGNKILLRLVRTLAARLRAANASYTHMEEDPPADDRPDVPESGTPPTERVPS
jgi:serine/threonine protein phosphatase PrpC